MKRPAMAALAGLAAAWALTLAAPPAAHANEEDYLANLRGLMRVPSGDFEETMIELGEIVCTAQSSGFGKSDQEALVEMYAEKSDYIPGKSDTYKSWAKKIRISATLFLC